MAATFKRDTDSADQWRWRRRHSNGNGIADSGEGSASKAKAKHTESVKSNAPDADVEAQCRPDRVRNSKVTGPEG